MPQQLEKTEPAAAPQNKTELDVIAIQRILPHRYPFLLIDRVVEVVPHRRIVALKNVTANEPFFQGHFPGHPIMPGVLIVEAMAQAGGALLLTEIEDREHKLLVFGSIERARFRKPVVPGDQLRFEVEVAAWRKTAARLRGTAYVDGKRVCDATMSCQILSRTAEMSRDADSAS